MELTNKEMYQVKGGAVKWGVVASIAATVITFILGFVSGYSNPVKCNN